MPILETYMLLYVDGVFEAHKLSGNISSSLLSNIFQIARRDILLLTPYVFPVILVIKGPRFSSTSLYEVWA